MSPATAPAADLLSVPDAELDRELCRRSLGDFIRSAWPVLEPATDYVHGWHIDALVEHLEAVEAREIRNLVINIPPRYMKSLSVCVFFPAWAWIRDPGARFLTASYKEALANRDAGKMRRLVKHPWYQVRWGHLFDFRSDQDVKTHFENTEGGHRVSFGAGTGTGEGGDFVIVDDPHDVEKAESRKEREATLQWWDEVMSTRLNDPATGCKVIVMQRLHQRDLTAHVLEQGGYEHLMIPTEYDADRHCTTAIGWEDPRDEEGELAWPERFGREAVAERKKRLGPHGVAGQLQQRPTSRSGGLFQEDWFPAVPESEVPPDCDWVRYWDKAATEGGGSYTVGVLMAREPDSERAWVVDVVRGQWGAKDREEKIDETAEEDARRLGGKTEFRIRVEQEPGSGGKDSALATKRRLSRKGYSVQIDNPASQGNKFVRADPLSGAAEAGDVKVVEGSWNQAFIRELGQAGPGAEYLDQMDAAAGAYNALAEEDESTATLRWR